MNANTAPSLSDFLRADSLEALIRAARDEDLGPAGHDITSEALIEPSRMAEAHLVPRQPGVLAGGALLPAIAAAYDHRITVTTNVADGTCIKAQQPLAHFNGPLRSMLAMERVALNFVTHLSGIATLTDDYVRAAEGTSAQIYDTRKTIPGLRALAKYAVVCGGGRAHRVGLYDAMLVKDNHLAGVSLERLADVLRAAIDRARAAHHEMQFVEVEVDTLAQLERVLNVGGVDIVLLDNMDMPTLREAVALRDRLAPHVSLEASGGVTLEATAEIARTGVDRIAIGALTHSAPALDVGLDLY